MALAAAPAMAPGVSVYVRRVLMVDCGVARSVQIPTPAGRSLMMPSRLSSSPVVSLYTLPLRADQDTLMFRFLTCVLLTERLTWNGASAAPFPHSVSRLPPGGGSNGPTALRRARIQL